MPGLLVDIPPNGMLNVCGAQRYVVFPGEIIPPEGVVPIYTSYCLDETHAFAPVTVLINIYEPKVA